MMGHKEAVFARLADMVVFAANGCIEFFGYHSPDGYGRIGINGRGKTAMVHRVAYEQVIGPIPAGLTIDHLCRNRCCVNPAHMEPVSNRENILRGETLAAHNHRKTHCVHGHVLPERDARGRRICRVCIKQSNDTRSREEAKMYMRKRRAAQKIPAESS